MDRRASTPAFTSALTLAAATLLLAACGGASAPQAGAPATESNPPVQQPVQQHPAQPPVGAGEAPAVTGNSGEGNSGEGNSGSGNAALRDGSRKVVADGARIEVGQPVELELRTAAAFRGLDSSRTRYQVRFEPEPNGLNAVGPVIAGTARRATTVRAIVTADAPDGKHVEQIIRIAAVRSATHGEPDAATLMIDYLGTGLPSRFSDPAGSVAPADNTPADNPATNAGIALGRALFYDTRLSADGTVACASCHVQSFAFSDPEPRSRGIRGRLGQRHSSGLSNARYQADGLMFWDQRSMSLESQVIEPIRDPSEMGNQLSTLVATLRAIPFYPPLFERAFGSTEINTGRVSEAIAQFERSLVSSRSRYDLAMSAADPSMVFTPEENRGRALFDSMGCVVCHQGDLQSGSIRRDGSSSVPSAHNVGLDAVPVDPGKDRQGIFKTPSLRNVSLSAPYMHDGRFATLEEVVRFFADGVIDTPLTSAWLREGNVSGAPIRRTRLSDADVGAMVAFLRTLEDTEFARDPRFSDPFPAVSP